MAAGLAPSAFHSWAFQKARSHGESPQSDRSSSDFFDAQDKLGITPTMEEIRAALESKSDPMLNKEYMSSEEALSPMIDAELSEGEEQEEEDLEAGYEADEDLWEGVKFINIDIAIAICVIATGHPKVIDLGPPSTSSLDMVSGLPLRTDSLPPIIPTRSQNRTPDRRLQPRLSNTSLQAYSSTTTTPTDSPDSASSYASNRHISIFSMPNHNISNSFTPPLSEQGSESPTPSFLQTDPFENARSKPTHSRFRSISSKFSKLTFSSKNSESKAEEAKKLSKKERRNSLMRPATPMSIFDGRTSDSSEFRDLARPVTPLPTFISPLQTTPTQRTFSRMVPRDADERRPAINLPPCPDDYDFSPPELPRAQTSFIPRKPLHSPQDVNRRKSLLGLGALELG